MLHHDIWLLWTFLQPRILTIFLFKFAEKSDGERVNLSYFTLLWVGLARSKRKERLVVAQD